MTDLPRRAVTRSARLASLPLGVAGRSLVGLGRRVAGRSQEEVNAELQARTAQQLFEVLGNLKGGAMKVGQALSVMEAALPEELVAPYRESLSRLQEAAPSLPPPDVHRILEQELGSDWRSRFQQFGDEAVAAASIGQVHRAVWSDGRDVAVKVQYPGAAEALMSDIRQLSRTARMSAGWLPGLDLEGVLYELKQRAAEETLYDLEAAAQDAFAHAYAGDPDVLVPAVVVGTERVLVSEWVGGTPLSQVIADGTAAERDRVSEVLLSLLMGAPGRSGLLHADPHPGNFRLLPDGRVGVLDFGAVHRLPDGLPPALGRMVTQVLDRDAESLLEELVAEDFVRGSVRVDPEQLLDFLGRFITPLETEEFTFERDWLRGVFDDLKDPRSTAFSLGIRLNLPPDYLMIYRAWLGGLAVLCQVGGTVRARDVVAREVPGFEPPSSAA